MNIKNTYMAYYIVMAWCHLFLKKYPVAGCMHSGYLNKSCEYFLILSQFWTKNNIKN